MSTLSGLLLVVGGLTAVYGFDDTLFEEKARHVPGVENSTPGYGPIPLAILPATVECAEEGFLPDPTDPTIFYRCLETVKGDFEVFKFWCRDGRNWDQERQVCRYDSPVPKPLPKAEYAERIRTESSPNIECKEEGFIADPADPTSYYKCIQTGQGQFIFFQFHCQGGRKWDQERQACRQDPLIPKPLPGKSQLV